MRAQGLKLACSKYGRGNRCLQIFTFLNRFFCPSLFPVDGEDADELQLLRDDKQFLLVQVERERMRSLEWKRKAEVFQKQAEDTAR